LYEYIYIYIYIYIFIKDSTVFQRHLLVYNS